MVGLKMNGGKLRILGSCSMVDMKRVIEAVKTGQDPLPEELYKPKGRLALAFVILTMEAGMELEDMVDIRQVKLWDNNRFEADLFPRVDKAKGLKWKAALEKCSVSLNSAMRRFKK